MKKAKGFGLMLLFLFTFGVAVFHAGVFPRPTISPADIPANPFENGNWRDRSEAGIHQLILEGKPYARGLAAGLLTHDLIDRQEKELVLQLDRFFPSLLIFKILEIPAILWFKGVEHYFEPWMVQEIAGVAEGTSHEFDFLGDRLTRQIAYHGLHEVGQMMVDQSRDDMGCTVLALPTQNGWYIGRNFDFEGGRIFDTEKIMKWVFPDQGYPFVSVSWAGMVGVVTGVNSQGVYVSLNAAGSTDFVRLGTPSTLVALKALQFSKNAEEAVQTIQKEQMFITDIFVVSDRTSKKLFRIEKSPLTTEVIELTGPSVVTNHLISPGWNDDRINVFRRENLTSRFREERGNALLEGLASKIPTLNSSQLELALLAMLRDKGDDHGIALDLGNRRAIDSLIATHSVIFNQPENVLFVSKGPSLVGEFQGYDLTRSFKVKSPILVRTLPKDTALNEERYIRIKLGLQEATHAAKLATQKKCAEAETLLNTAATHFQEGYLYEAAHGDVLECKGEHSNAVQHWQNALDHFPAYTSEIQNLGNKVFGVRGTKQ